MSGERDYAALLAEIERLREQDKTQLQEILRLCRENERLREALAELSAWQPKSEYTREGLHPQHRSAIERAEVVLSAAVPEERE